MLILLLLLHNCTNECLRLMQFYELMMLNSNKDICVSVSNGNIQNLPRLCDSLD